MSDLGNFKSYFTPEMAKAQAQGVENHNHILDQFGQMGVTVSKLMQEQEQNAAQRDYQKQKLQLDRENLMQDKAQKDRQYLLDYQKTVNDAEAHKADASYKQQAAQIALNKENRANMDWSDQKQRTAFMQQPENAQAYAKAYTTGKIDHLSATQLAALPPKDFMGVMKSTATNAKTNKDKEAINTFYDRYGPDIIGIDSKLHVDPTTGKSNAQELYKPVLDKITDDMNNGRIDRATASKQLAILYAKTAKLQQVIKGNSSSAATPPPVFGAADLDATGTPINQRTYLTNTPEGLAQLQKDQIEIQTNPNAGKVMTKSTFNKNGALSGTQVIKPGKQKKKSIFDE